MDKNRIKHRATARFLLENLKQEECLENYKRAIASAKEEHEVTDNGNEEWIYFRDKITEIATNIVQKKMSYGRKKKQTAWWTDELREAVAEKMRKYRRWMKTRLVDDKIIYDAAARERSSLLKEYQSGSHGNG